MQDLKKQNVWVCWKYVSKSSGMTKMPFAAAGGNTGTSPDHCGEWTDFVSAASAAKKPEIGFDGIGFVMPEGYFLLDVDHKDMDDPMMKELISMFPTYLERSPPAGTDFTFMGEPISAGFPKAGTRTRNATRWMAGITRKTVPQAWNCISAV